MKLRLGKNGGTFWRGPDRQALHRRGSLLAGATSSHLSNQHQGMIRDHAVFLVISPHSEWRGTNKIVVKNDWRRVAVGLKIFFGEEGVGAYSRRPPVS